jgi:hypothetical protein
MTEPMTQTEMSKPGEILYRAFFDELRFAKQQQWTITNYTLLLMAGVFGVAKAISPATFGKFILCVIVFLIWGLNLFVLLDLQGYIQSVRRRQTDMEETFSAKDKSLARGERPSHPNVFDNVYEFTFTRLPLAEIELFLVVLCLVVTVAMLIAWLAISQT